MDKQMGRKVASWLSGNTLSYGDFMLTSISQSYPWLWNKGDYWVVWIHNSHVHDISTTLITSSSTERVIHSGDLIWDKCQTRLG